jgi:hypothetical protein
MVVKNLLLFCILLIPVGRLSAQVTVDVVTEQDEFLPGEDIPAVAHIVNHSGETLKLGNDNEWLKFSVSGRDGYVVLKSGDVPVNQPFTLESSERATVHVNLAPYFHMPRAGHYLITATVTIPGWTRQVNSSPKGFDVIQGARLWQEQFGVPSRADTTNAMPEVRTYALQEANYLRSRLMLYAQVSDRAGKLNKVVPIGPMVSFGQPEPKVDKSSNLNVLYQNGPHTFNYTVVNPDGNIILRQTYDFTSRPQMMANADGELSIVGGTRRVTRNDIPPPTVTSIDTNVLSPP